MYRLNVLITCRDRPILLEKCIDSILDNSTIFKEIHIYAMDNYSEFSIERYFLFKRLLDEKKICYYSYDNNISTVDCFPKAIAWNRWINMMKINKAIRISNKIDKLKDIYLLTDNDMLYGPKWDQYFISALNFMEMTTELNDIHYLVNYPGGVPKHSLQHGIKFFIKNEFNENEENKFQIIGANHGGGSGCWILNHTQLESMEWDIGDYSSVYKYFKRHDQQCWRKIYNKYSGKRINYVLSVVPPDGPIVLHLGGILGSMCNLLSRNCYKDQKTTLELKEKDLEGESHEIIFESFKDLDKARYW